MAQKKTWKAIHITEPTLREFKIECAVAGKSCREVGEMLVSGWVRRRTKREAKTETV